MGTRVIDQSLFISDNDSSPISTSSNYRFITINGDTLQIADRRAISSSTDTGNKGELCLVKTTLLFVDTYWLYYCYEDNHWVRTAFGGGF